MRYRRDYQETHDIDWFFRYKGKVYHAASNGGLIPDKVDSLNNRILQEKIEDIVGYYEVGTSEGLNLVDEDISSFLEYAARGFISLDRVEGENGNVYYQIIAFPKNGEMFENEELVNLMPLLEADEIIIDK